MTTTSTPLTDDDLAKITVLARSFESVLVPQRTMLRLLDEVAAHRTLTADVLAIHANRNGFCDACFEADESPSDDAWAVREPRRLRQRFRWPCPTARIVLGDER